MIDQALYDRLIAKMRVDPERGCWIWTGTLRPTKWDANRYGYISAKHPLGLKHRSINTHRAMWFALHGVLPTKIHVLHRCDVPQCINPDHLFTGTHQDNMADRDRKVRQWRARMVDCHNGHPLSGENLYIDPRGYRTCRICERASQRRRYHAKKAAPQMSIP